MEEEVRHMKKAFKEQEIKHLKESYIARVSQVSTEVLVTMSSSDGSRETRLKTKAQEL